MGLLLRFVDLWTFVSVKATLQSFNHVKILVSISIEGIFDRFYKASSRSSSPLPIIGKNLQKVTLNSNPSCDNCVWLYGSMSHISSDETGSWSQSHTVISHTH